MTRRQRTAFFTIAVIIFFVVSPAIILYAAGYRIDPLSRKLVKTGGISLTAIPAPVNVFIDGNFTSSNSFLFQNIFISNLLPKNYAVLVAKDGYYPWQKTLKVEEEQVTEALDVILYPKNSASLAVAPHVTLFSPSPDGAHILFVQSGDAGDILLLKQGQLDPVAIKTLNKNEAIQQIFWAQNSTSFLLLEKIKGTLHLLLADALSKSDALQDLSSFIPPAILSHSVLSSFQLSEDKQLLYLLSSPSPAEEGIYILHLDTHLFEGPVQENVSGFLNAQDRVYMVGSPTGVLSQCSPDLTSCTQISSGQADLGGVGFSTLVADDAHLVLLQDKKLYLYQPDKQTFMQLADGVDAVYFAPDKQKMAIQKDHEVSVYWFKDITRADLHKQGDLNLLLRISEKISGVSWLGDPYQYIAVESNDALRIIELDGRDTRNIVSYPEFSSTQNIVWQKNSADLILLHGQTLLQDFVEEQAH